MRCRHAPREGAGHANQTQRARSGTPGEPGSWKLLLKLWVPERECGVEDADADGRRKEARGRQEVRVGSGHHDVSVSLGRRAGLRVGRRVSLLGLLAKIKCSICSYQFNI